MEGFSAEKAIERARQICKYEPEFNYDEETGMVQIWDYSEDYEQSFHREDYCRPDQINMNDLLRLIDENGFLLVSSLYDACHDKDSEELDER